MARPTEKHLVPTSRFAPGRVAAAGLPTAQRPIGLADPSPPPKGTRPGGFSQPARLRLASSCLGVAPATSSDRSFRGVALVLRTPSPVCGVEQSDPAPPC